MICVSYNPGTVGLVLAQAPGSQLGFPPLQHPTIQAILIRASQVPLVVDNLPVQVDIKRHGFDPWIRRSPRLRKWQHAQYPCLKRFHGQRSPNEAYSPWVWESDRTEHTLESKEARWDGAGRERLLQTGNLLGLG